MNIPNAVTITRILLIPVFLVALIAEIPHGDALAVGVVALAAGTDKLDGYLARRRNSVTSTGKILDPLADKLLIASALIALVGLHRVPAWVAMVIIGREFAVTALRLVASSQGVSIPVSRLAKLKTGSQSLAVLFLLVRYTSMPHYTLVEDILLYGAVALTLASGIEYFVNARVLLSKPPRPAEQDEGSNGGEEGP